jgi:ABC-type nickel/cobalt efflux system permease component RcnA
MTPFLLRFIKTVIFLLCLWGLLFLNWWSGKNNKKVLRGLSTVLAIFFIVFVIWSKFGL